MVVTVRRPLLLIALGVVLFSTGPVVVASATTSGPVLSFWRLWIGAAVMGTLSLVQIRRSGVRPDGVGWRWAGRCGVAFGIHQLFFMVAIRRTSVVDVTLMQVLQPVFVGFLAAALLGERPGRRFRAWSLVAVAGAAVVVLAGAGGPTGSPVGMALAALNVAFFAVYFVWSKQARDHIDTVPFLFGVVVAAGVLVGLFDLVAGEPVTSITAPDLGRALFIAVIPGALGHFVTTWPLRQVAANVPPVMQLAMPFLAGGLAFVFLGQPITWLHVVGGGITIVGVVGSLRSPSAAVLVVAGPDPTMVPGD